MVHRHLAARATRKLAGHTGERTWGSVSPDGRMLATGSTDGTIRLFDLATQRPVGAPLPGPPNRQIAPVFTPDGAYLFVITDARRGYRWDIRPSSWARHACKIAGRRLTRTEWNDVLPERDYGRHAPAEGVGLGGQTADLLLRPRASGGPADYDGSEFGFVSVLQAFRGQEWGHIRQ